MLAPAVIDPVRPRCQRNAAHAGERGGRAADADRLQRRAVGDLLQPGGGLRRLGRLPARAGRGAGARRSAAFARIAGPARCDRDPGPGRARRLGLRRRAVVALALLGRHAARRLPGAGGRRLRRPRRDRHRRLPGVLHRPGRCRHRQQRDRPDPGVRAAARRRRLDRPGVAPRPRHRQRAPAQSPEQPAALVGGGGDLARRGPGDLSRDRLDARPAVHRGDRPERVAHRPPRHGRADGLGPARPAPVARHPHHAALLAARLPGALGAHLGLGAPHRHGVRRRSEAERQRPLRLLLALQDLVELARPDRPASLARRRLRRVQLRLDADAFSRPSGRLLRPCAQPDAAVRRRARHSAHRCCCSG